MCEFGYARISSKDQNPSRQLDALLDRGVEERNIYVDYESGKDFNRPQYKNLMNRLRYGDSIVIKSIDRLGRNYGEILDQWRIITQMKGVFIEVLDMPLLNTSVQRDNLTGRLISDLVLQILAYVAETERSFIKQRQREGIISAKKRGICFGRPKVKESDLFEVAYFKWLKGQLSSREAAAFADMKHSTFYRRCKERKMYENSVLESRQ